MADFERVEALFQDALQKPAGADRSSWLRERCRGDAELLAEVESLLVHHDLAGTENLENRLIGRGGMSSVYLADRIDGRLDQKVAVKVMAALHPRRVPHMWAELEKIRGAV